MKKPDIANKIKIRERIRKGKAFHLPRRASGDKNAADDSFAAMVHSSQPIMRLKSAKPLAEWRKDLVSSVSLAVLLTVVLALFCMSIDSPQLILFALPCPAVLMAVATAGSVKPGAVRWVAAGAAAVILIAAAIIWRSAIFSGIGMLINRFYDAAEEAQAYLYERLPVGEGAYDSEGGAGMAWLSGLIGLLAALLPVKSRRGISGAVAILVMLAFAYYGLIPSAICIAVMIAALIMAVSRGKIASFLPVILAALVIFGVVVLIDPGENYGISRMDENFRDRFALRSALIESSESLYDDLDDEEFEEDYEDEDDEYFEEEDEEIDYAYYAVYGIIILAAAAVGAVIYLLYRRLARKRALIRKGIDSQDAREAVTAMFPYAVRWLKGYGIEQTGPSFASMEPAVNEEFSGYYAETFMKMYDLWREAAYSDHEITESSRLLMERFTADTVKNVKDKCRLRDKLRLKLRYAL